MKLLTLMEIEIKKVLPILIAVLSLMIVVSSMLFYRLSETTNSMILRELNQISVQEYVALYGEITLPQILEYNQGLMEVLFGFTAVLLVIVLTFYLWYKEWFGQSKRIYMLLSLRGSRFTILLAKLLTVLGASFIFYGAILLSLGIGGIIANVLLPDGIFAFTPISSVLAQARPLGLGFSFPLTFSNFIYKIFFVTAAFSGISVWVLFDRSIKVWGFILGGFYCIILANLYLRTLTTFLFFDERMLVDWSFALGACTVGLALSYFLLNKKISI